MMRSTFAIVLIGLLFASDGVAVETGRIVFLDGDVRLIRGPLALDAHDLGLGAGVGSGDVIETGRTGSAEVSLHPDNRAVVMISPGTSYSATRMPEHAGGHTAIELFAGKVSLAVDRSRDNSRFEVTSRGAVFGVRGTEFDVMTSPDGAVLLGVRSGSVRTDTLRFSADAVAGQAVEVLPSGSLSTVAVPVERMDEYFEIWLRLRSEVFSSDPEFFLDAYARRYQQHFDRFFSDSESFLEHHTTLERLRGGSGSSADQVRDRSRIAPSAIATRASMVPFEEVFYTLLDILRMIPESRVELLADRAAEFVATFERERSSAWIRLGEVRSLLHVYDEVQRVVPGF